MDRNDPKVKPLKDVEFTSLEEALLNPRIQLLMMRNHGVPALKNIAVPLNERDIPLSLLKQLDRREDHVNEISQINSSQSLESRRKNAIKIIENLRKNIMDNSQDGLDRPQTVEDLVHEEESESVGFELLEFLTGGSRRRVRPLRPTRRERSTFGSNEESSFKSVIVVNIMHAHNVPLRTLSEKTEKVLASDILKEGNRKSSFVEEHLVDQSECNSAVRVNPFVEVVFGKEVVRTSTAEGNQPTWNETLIIDLSR
jgi:coiled-coil and C2 domain-containing protein 2A